MIPFVRKKDTEVFNMKAKLYVVISCSAILTSVSYFLQLLCATYVPATVQFPVMSGGTIVFTALFGMICFKEKLSIRQALCLLLCIVSTIVFVL